MSGQAVERLQIRRIARDAPQQPGQPRHRLVPEPAAQQTGQGEGGVAEPAEPVVPVAFTSDTFRQGGRRRRDDTARGRVGERLERDQGAHHRLAPGPPVTALGRPVLPEVDGAAQRGMRVTPAGHGQMGRRPDEHQGQVLARGDAEVEERAVAFRVDTHLLIGAQPYGVGAGHRDGVRLGGARPRHHPPVVETQSQLSSHVDRSREAFDASHQAGRTGARRHEVRDLHGTRDGFPEGVQHQGVSPVRPAIAGSRPCGGEPPVPVVPRTEQCRETGGRVETGKTQPVHRPVPADEGRRLQVADDGVVLDQPGHEGTSP